MIASGERLDFSSLSRPTADKHSTGGVGDKIIAAAGAAGRGLRRRRAAAVGPRPRPHRRHAGQAGVDPRLARRALARARCRPSSRRSGAVICAAARRLAPADRKLYALRDVTGTVESIPLIAASIMSKKIAEGTEALVLDVKVGSGAFMKRADQRRGAGAGRWSNSAHEAGVTTGRC